MYAKKKEAKGKYRQRIKGHFENTDPRSMWRGIKTLTDYKYKTTLVSEEEQTLTSSAPPSEVHLEKE